MCQQEAPAKIVKDKPNNAPLPQAKKETSLPHRKNGSHVERKDCPHRRNTPNGEPPPPHLEFFIHAPPLASAIYSPPLRAPIMISNHFIPFV